MLDYRIRVENSTGDGPRLAYINVRNGVPESSDPPSWITEGKETTIPEFFAYIKEEEKRIRDLYSASNGTFNCSIIVRYDAHKHYPFSINSWTGGCEPSGFRIILMPVAGDIVTDVGTLKYIRTLWDRASIYEGQKIDNEIWVYGDNNGASLFKGMDKPVSIPIEVSGNIRYLIYPPNRLLSILPKGDYINFLVGDYANGIQKENKFFYIARVHRATMARQYFRIPKLDGEQWPSVYRGNNDVFFRRNDNYYMLNESCDNVIEITEQEFHDLYSPSPDYVTDDEGRYYRLNNGREFEVSIDNGKTWYGNTMERNFSDSNEPNSIIIQNNSIFILCMHTDTWGTLGGGIHEYKWETEDGEE
jgi:hypothetical protein